jgi:hypothetical protein
VRKNPRSTVGAEAAIEQLRQQKVLAEQAIQALVSSGTMGTDEIAINVAAMIEQLTAPFDALEERAVSVDFSAIGSAFARAESKLRGLPTWNCVGPR